MYKTTTFNRQTQTYSKVSKLPNIELVGTKRTKRGEENEAFLRKVKFIMNAF